jgi:hypothetical protein
MLRGGWANSLTKNQEGIAVDPLLARAGCNLVILIQTKFEKGEAPQR